MNVRILAALSLAAALLVSLADGVAAGDATGSAVADPIGDSAPDQLVVRSPDCSELTWFIDSALARPPLKGAEVSLLVESLSTGAVLCERNADRPMIPASNMKLVTAAAALSVLGPSYRFETVVSTDAPAVGATLHGNLYVRGTGDPSFVTEELYKLVESIRVRGIERIEGDIVLDASWFDSVATTSDIVSRGDRAYHARTGALSLNFSGLAVHVSPGSKDGERAVVKLAPETSFVDVRNEASTVRRGSRAEPVVRRDYRNGRNVITVTGGIPEGAEPHVAYRNLDDGLGYYGSTLRRFLGAAGVTVTGVVRHGSAPEGSRAVAVHRSKPLALIVHDLNKYSNNFVAEQLLKAMSAETFGPPGTTAGGVRVLSDFLRSTGADSDSYVIVDGSGFSRNNRLTARVLLRVMSAALSDFGHSYEFASSLSVSGTDGTLEDRMGYPALQGSVRAKTGLLDGVTAISGILRREGGDEVLVSVIVNGFDCDAWRVHDFEHGVLALLR